MRQNFGINEVACIAASIANYQQLASSFPQYGHGNDEQKKRIDDLLIKHKSKDKYWDSPVMNTWEDISIHVTLQTWGSTACGWGGIGGAAMTTAMNVVIHNHYTDLVFVYWGGDLAYITAKENVHDFERCPSLREVKNPLYIKTFRR